MDDKMMAILMKAKAVDNATAQKSGEKRAPARRNTPTPVNRDYFDEPEVEYLTEAPMSAPSSGGGGGGLFDQMGVSGGGSGGGPTSTPLTERMDINSSAYESSVENSGLPPAIRQAMLDNPIPIGEGGTGVSEDFIKKINPNMGRTQVPELPQIQEQQYDSYDEEDEGEYYSHPIKEEKIRPREVPNTQRRQITETTQVGTSEIRRMIAQEIAKALPVVIEQYFDKRVLKENVQFKAGETTFSGTVAPLPRKRTKKKK